MVKNSRQERTKLFRLCYWKYHAGKKSSGNLICRTGIYKSLFETSKKGWAELKADARLMIKAKGDELPPGLRL